MSARRVDAFFYGLFMDADLLRESGGAPTNPRRARVDGYAELDRLYGGPGLDQYRPEAVLAQPVDGPATPALCYNLIAAPAAHERNSEYAARAPDTRRPARVRRRRRVTRWTRGASETAVAASGRAPPRRGSG